MLHRRQTRGSEQGWAVTTNLQCRLTGKGHTLHVVGDSRHAVGDSRYAVVSPKDSEMHQIYVVTFGHILQL